MRASSFRGSGRSGRFVAGAAALALAAACSGGGDKFTVTSEPASLSFSASQYGALPATQILSVRFTGEAFVAGYPAGSQVPTWLAVALLDETASSATLSVRPSTTSLAPGNYSATLRLVTGRLDGSGIVYRDVPVQYVVTAAQPYAVTVEPASLEFTAELGGPAPAAQDLSVTFNGQVLVAGYPAGTTPPTWLTVTGASTYTSPATISVRPNLTSLTPGTYTATLRVGTARLDGGGLVYEDVPVQYVVTAGLQASPASLAFSAVDGVAPEGQSITLSSDAFPKSWTAAVEPRGNGPTDWLGVSPATGTLSSGTANLQITAAARPPGTYAAAIAIRDGASSLRALIPVSYEVAQGFTLSGTLAPRVTEAATLASLDLPLELRTALAGAAGAGHLWQATASADWLSVVPGSGDLSADATLAVRLDPAKLWALANGTYQATVTVSTTQGGATSASVPVTLTVAIAPALSAPATVSYAVGVATTGADLARTVPIASNLGEVFADRGGWHATASAAWLDASAAGGGSLALGVVPAALEGLANGAYATSVTISADDPRVAGDTIQATMQLALPDVAHVAPYLTWVGRGEDVVVRGSGFGSAGTVPVLFGAEPATGTVVSDTELRVTAPTQAAAGQVPVSIANALGITRAASELVVVEAPAYASHQATLAGTPAKMELDPERQAVLLSGGSTTEIRRFRFAGGTWTQDAFQAPNATAACVMLDGKALLVTSGTTGSPSQTFLELDPATFAVRKTTGFGTYYERFDLVAGFNDGRVLILDSDQWTSTVWYPSFARGPYVYAWHPNILVTRDRSRMLVDDQLTGGVSSLDAGDASSTQRPSVQSVGYRRLWGVSGDGGRLVAGTAVYGRDFGFLGSVSLPDRGVFAVAVSSDGAALYTLARNPADTAWVFRRTGIGGPGPYTADAAALPFAIAADETPIAMAVSEDGGTLFLLTLPQSGGSIFRALPLP